MPSPQEWAQKLKSEWNERARSPRHRFYIASHPGWNDEPAWERQALNDVGLVLSFLDASRFADWDVLEIGCGVGRLARHIASKVRSYTGIDVAPAFVEQARGALEGHPKARFFESDGAGIPLAAKDRAYDLVFALAVFVHCPADVIASVIRDALPLVKKGGRFRMQFLADPADSDGMLSPPSQAAIAEAEIRDSVEKTMAELQAAGETHLVEETSYRGEVFRYRDLRAFLTSLVPEDVRVHLGRYDPAFIYADLIRSADG